MLKSKKVSSDEVFLGEESQVKFKTAGNTREVVFLAGVNKSVRYKTFPKINM